MGRYSMGLLFINMLIIYDVFRYSMGLFTVLPLAFPFMRFINTHNYEATGVGVVCNILCAWVRYVARRRAWRRPRRAGLALLPPGLACRLVPGVGEGVA